MENCFYATRVARTHLYNTRHPLAGTLPPQNQFGSPSNYQHKQPRALGTRHHKAAASDDDDDDEDNDDDNNNDDDDDNDDDRQQKEERARTSWTTATHLFAADCPPPLALLCLLPLTLFAGLPKNRLKIKIKITTVFGRGADTQTNEERLEAG
jgi:hypothetical protein